MKRRERIDSVLARPDARELIERLKGEFAVASGHHAAGDQPAHLEAAFAARAVLFELVRLVREHPGNQGLPTRPLYHYLTNVAFHELTTPIASERQRREVELVVYLPPGRPVGQTSFARQRVIEDLRQNPDLADWQVKDRAIKYGAWKPGQSDDASEVRRRIKRLRDDAAK